MVSEARRKKISEARERKKLALLDKFSPILEQRLTTIFYEMKDFFEGKYPAAKNVKTNNNQLQLSVLEWTFFGKLAKEALTKIPNAKVGDNFFDIHAESRDFFLALKNIFCSINGIDNSIDVTYDQIKPLAENIFFHMREALYEVETIKKYPGILNSYKEVHRALYPADSESFIEQFANNVFTSFLEGARQKKSFDSFSIGNDWKLSLKGNDVISPDINLSSSEQDNSAPIQIKDGSTIVLNAESSDEDDSGLGVDTNTDTESCEYDEETQDFSGRLGTYKTQNEEIENSESATCSEDSCPASQVTELSNNSAYNSLLELIKDLEMRSGNIDKKESKKILDNIFKECESNEKCMQSLYNIFQNIKNQNPYEHDLKILDSFFRFNVYENPQECDHSKDATISTATGNIVTQDNEDGKDILETEDNTQIQQSNKEREEMTDESNARIINAKLVIDKFKNSTADEIRKLLEDIENQLSAKQKTEIFSKQLLEDLNNTISSRDFSDADGKDLKGKLLQYSNIINDDKSKENQENAVINEDSSRGEVVTEDAAIDAAKEEVIEEENENKEEVVAERAVEEVTAQEAVDQNNEKVSQKDNAVADDMSASLLKGIDELLKKCNKIEGLDCTYLTSQRNAVVELQNKAEKQTKITALEDHISKIDTYKTLKSDVEAISIKEQDKQDKIQQKDTLIKPLKEAGIETAQAEAGFDKQIKGLETDISTYKANITNFLSSNNESPDAYCKTAKAVISDILGLKDDNLDGRLEDLQEIFDEGGICQENDGVVTASFEIPTIATAGDNTEAKEDAPHHNEL